MPTDSLTLRNFYYVSCAVFWRRFSQKLPCNLTSDLTLQRAMDHVEQDQLRQLILTLASPFVQLLMAVWLISLPLQVVKLYSNWNVPTVAVETHCQHRVVDWSSKVKWMANDGSGWYLWKLKVTNKLDGNGRVIGYYRNLFYRRPSTSKSKWIKSPRTGVFLAQH